MVEYRPKTGRGRGYTPATQIAKDMRMLLKTQQIDMRLLYLAGELRRKGEEFLLEDPDGPGWTRGELRERMQMRNLEDDELLAERAARQDPRIGSAISGLRAAEDIDKVIGLVRKISEKKTLTPAEVVFLVGDDEHRKAQDEVRREHVMEQIAEAHDLAKRKKYGKARAAELIVKSTLEAEKEAETIFLPTPVEGSLHQLTHLQTTESGRISAQIRDKKYRDEDHLKELQAQLEKSDRMNGALYLLSTGLEKLKCSVQRAQGQSVGQAKTR